MVSHRSQTLEGAFVIAEVQGHCGSQVAFCIIELLLGGSLRQIRSKQLLDQVHGRIAEAGLDFGFNNKHATNAVRFESGSGTVAKSTTIA
ncbi:hypothetical protein D3C85_1687300 [compost metagenome]